MSVNLDNNKIGLTPNLLSGGQAGLSQDRAQAIYRQVMNDRQRNQLILSAKQGGRNTIQLGVGAVLKDKPVKFDEYPLPKQEDS